MPQLEKLLEELKMPAFGGWPNVSKDTKAQQETAVPLLASSK